MWCNQGDKEEVKWCKQGDENMGKIMQGSYNKEINLIRRG